jgi:MerR family transcriptional regulator/heat shock protein HspR
MVQQINREMSNNPEINRPLYTLGITSQLAEIPAHSIRQYIDMGLLIPYKSESKRHLFSQNDINRLKQIQRLLHERGLNFAGVRTMMAMIPCWAIRKCSESDRNSCGAYDDNFQPCWDASEKGRLCRNENCRECEVYNILNLDTGIKPVLRALL